MMWHKKQNWMMLRCCVNDVRHLTLRLGNRTFAMAPLEKYKENIRNILKKPREADTKVLILTSTMFGEPAYPRNIKN